jgi:hypothetical protein
MLSGIIGCAKSEILPPVFTDTDAVLFYNIVAEMKRIWFS